MPRGDRTGPMGMGPMTGGARGYCAGYPVPGYVNAGPGFGAGWGGGWGRGWRHRFYATGVPGWMRFGYGPAWGYGPPAPPTTEQEAEDLKAHAEWLQDELDAVRRRIEEIEKEP